MKNYFRSYVISWLALFILFSMVAILGVGWIGQEKYTPSFWIGYAFIVVTFLGQLGCAYAALKDKGAKKMFYNISLLRTSYAGLIASFIFGGVCMLISPLPYWVGGILCTLVLVCNILAVVKASAAIEEVVAVDENVARSTFFIKSLTIDANSLTAKAQSDVARAECKKVYEAIRYSDPVSSNALAALENEITEKFALFADAVKGNDDLTVSAAAKELLVLIGERNQKCMLMK